MRKKILTVLNDILKSKQFLIFFIGFFIVSMLTAHYAGDLTTSRILTVRALVEHGTLAIESVPDMDTIDKIYRDGHFYSTKAPLPSILGAGIYYILYNVFDLKFSFLVYYILCVLTVALPFSFLLVFFYRALGLVKVKEEYKMLFTLSLGFGTLLFTYSASFGNHILSALFVFWAFYCLLKINFGGVIKINKLVALCGLSMSLAVSTEVVQGSIFFVTCFVYLLMNKETRKYSLYYIWGALPVILLYLLFNLQVTGNIFPAYLNSGLYEYAGSYWLEPRGIDALRHNKLLYLFNILIGSHGIFLYSPILIFGAWGITKVIFDRKHILYNLALWIALTAGLILFSLTVFTNNYGGLEYGFRWFIICYACIFFFISTLMDNFLNKRFLFYFFVILFCSFLFAYIGFGAFWYGGTYSFFGEELFIPLFGKLEGFFSIFFRV